MKTSERWWSETKADPNKLRAWLFDQYRGEATASGRIEALRDRYAAGDRRAFRILSVIAEQERKHAGWVAELMRARGIEPRIEEKASRYWAGPLAAIANLRTGCAVGAHAEKMRLERIEAICADAGAPADVREVFGRILREERFHERAFRTLAGAEAMNATRSEHARGREALGLVP